MTESVSVDQEGKNLYFCDSIQLWTWNGCSQRTPVSPTVLIFNPHMHWWRLHIKYVHNIFGQTVKPFNFCPIYQFYHICLTSVWFLCYRPLYSFLKLFFTFLAIRKNMTKRYHLQLHKLINIFCINQSALIAILMIQQIGEMTLSRKVI